MINTINLSGEGSFVVPVGVTRIFVSAVSLGIRTPWSAGTALNLRALRYGGSLPFAWGANSFGGLGDGTTVNRSAPTLIAGGRTFLQFTNSGLNTLALGADKLAYGWGYNNAGQVGDGTTNDRSVPTAVIGGHLFIQVSNSGSSNFGLKSDGTLWAWGSNANGALGDGTTTNRSSPVQVIGNIRFREFITSAVATAPSMAFDVNGVLWAWGNNGNGRLGDGTTENRSSPVMVIGNKKFRFIAHRASSVLGIDENNDMWGWGDNGNGRLGDGTIQDRSSPTAVVGGHKFATAVFIDSSFCVVALRTNGTALAWGQNSAGALGDGTVLSKSTPTSVLGGHIFSSLASSIGSNSAIALRQSDGAAFAWGTNTNGQLGDNTIANKSTPTLVSGGHVFSSVFTASASSYGVKSDGTIWAWGQNTVGQLGDNTIINRSVPIAVTGGALLADRFSSVQPPNCQAPGAASILVTPGASIPFRTGMFAGFGQNSFRNIDYFLVEF